MAVVGQGKAERKAIGISGGGVGQANRSDRGEDRVAG